MPITLTLANTGNNWLRDVITGADSVGTIYFAIGTGNSTPTASQTKLDAEAFRKAVTSFTNGASVGELLANGYLAPTDTVGTVIAEVGLFAGNSATTSANSGKMIGRALYSHTKSSTESITLQLDLTV